MLCLLVVAAARKLQHGSPKKFSVLTAASQDACPLELQQGVAASAVYQDIAPSVRRHQHALRQYSYASLIRWEDVHGLPQLFAGFLPFSLSLCPQTVLQLLRGRHTQQKGVK